MEAMYRLCEPSLKLVRKYIPNFGKNINQPEYNNWEIPNYNPDVVPSAPVLE